MRPRAGDSKAHLANLRRLPCCACGCPPPSTVHHLKHRRMSQRKSEDRMGIPLCMFRGEDCHTKIEAVGSRNELAWLAERGVGGLRLAEELWAARDNLEAMKMVERSHEGR